MTKSKDISESDFTNLALNTLGYGLIPIGRANFDLAKKYAREQSIAFGKWVGESSFYKMGDTFCSFKTDGREPGGTTQHTIEDLYEIFLTHQAQQP